MVMQLDNSGNGPLRVPGYGGVPLDYKHPFNLRFAHGHNEYQQSPAITARELEMLDVMSLISDKPDWYTGIFDDSIAEQWRQEFSSRKLMSDAAWDWCLAELKDKAVEFEANRFVQILDAGSSICKSDHCVTESVLQDLQVGLAPFFQDCANNHGKAFVAIDPTLFPLIYGESRVLEQGGRIELSDFGGKIGPDHGPILAGPRTDRLRDGVARYIDEGSEPYLQRLPCDVKFIGEEGNVTEITSPIHNLHPSHHIVYAAIEKLISASIPLWNACLIKSIDKPEIVSTFLTPWRLRHLTPKRKKQASEAPKKNDALNADQTQQGRIPLRIVTYGPSWDNEPSWEEVATSERLANKIAAYRWAKKISKTKPRHQARVNGTYYSAEQIVRHFSWVKQLPPRPKGMDATRDLPKPAWRHPEPGESFSYEDWREGRNVDRQIVKMIAQRSSDQPVVAGPTHTRYHVRLEETFRESGLQVIVEVGGAHFPDCRPSTIPLGGGLDTEEGPTPESYFTTFEDRNSTEMNPNEHIVATSLYIYDMDDAEGTIEFTQLTPMPSSVYRYENGHDGLPICCTDKPPELRTFRNGDREDELEALAQVFGFESRNDLDWVIQSSKFTEQRLGSIRLSQGRLLTFPNTLESRVSIHMQKGNEKGHLRWIKLYLVDPHYRICSTANVLPQQRNWSLCAKPLLEKGVPQELIDQIVSNVPAAISDERAKRLRRIMEKRSAERRGQLHIDRYDF